MLFVSCIQSQHESTSKLVRTKRWTLLVRAVHYHVMRMFCWRNHREQFFQKLLRKLTTDAWTTTLSFISNSYIHELYSTYPWCAVFLRQEIQFGLHSLLTVLTQIQYILEGVI